MYIQYGAHAMQPDIPPKMRGRSLLLDIQTLGGGYLRYAATHRYGSSSVNDRVIPLEQLPPAPHLRLAEMHAVADPSPAIDLDQPTQIGRRKGHERVRAWLLADGVRHRHGGAVRDARARAVAHRFRQRVRRGQGHVRLGDEVDAGFDGDGAADGVGDGLVGGGGEGGRHRDAVADGEGAGGDVTALGVGDHDLLAGLGVGTAEDLDFAEVGV